MEISENTEFVKLEYGSIVPYDEILYIKCGNNSSAFAKDDYGNGYEGYVIKGKCHMPDSYKAKTNNPDAHLAVWVSLNKIKDGVFESVHDTILGIMYISKETIKDDFEIIYDEKLNKIYGNVTFKNKNRKSVLLPEKINLTIKNGKVYVREELSSIYHYHNGETDIASKIIFEIEDSNISEEILQIVQQGYFNKK